MKNIRQVLCALLTAMLLLTVSAFSATDAYAADYQDGDYTVGFSVDGLGRHNVAWDTATVHVKDGKLYVDFTLERVDPRDHAPQYDWLKTACGTYTPIVNDAEFTATFTGVQVPNLGRVDVTVQTSAMSQPYEVDYVLHIDDSKIPLAAEPEPEPQPEPEPTPAPEPAPAPAPTPTPAPTPAPAPAPTPTPTPTPEPAPTDPVDPVEPAEPIEPAEPVDPNEPVSSEEPTEPDQPVEDEVIAPEPVPESVPVSPETLKYQDNHLPLSGGAIAAIVAGAVIVIGGVVWLILRNKKK